MALDDAAEFDKRRMRREALRYQRQQKQKRLIIGLIIAGVVLVACAVLIILLSRNAEPSGTEPGEETPTLSTTVPTEATQPPETVETQPPVSNTVINITIGGDMNVTDKTVASGGAAYDYTRVFQDVLPVLSEADLTILNFEGNLTGVPYGSENRSAPQRLVEALSIVGVDMVQMANSCSIVGGIIGLSNTLSNLRVAGLEPIGAYATEAEFNRSGGYELKIINGVRVGIVAFTKGMDGMALPAGSEKCVNVLYTDYATTYQSVDTDRINRILRNLDKEKPDIVIALVHWGSEYNDNISRAQEKVRDTLLEGGVDVIVGTHPHYVQSIVHDQEKGTLVAYSLGDFFSDGERAGTEYSILLHLQITKDNLTGITTLSSYGYTPLFTVAEKNDHRVVRLLEAIDAYDHAYVDSVDKETYEDMLYAKTRIEERIQPPAAEED